MENGKGKRYYWLKFHDDFFSAKRMKKLRRMDGGDTLAIIYLRMLLKAIGSDGALNYDGVEDDFASELALDLDEDVENVRRTLEFLEECGLAERVGDGYFLPEAAANVGSETASAQRVREHRGRAKTAESGEALQCNADVTGAKRVRNAEKEKDTEKRDRVRGKERESKRESVFTGEVPSPSSAFAAGDDSVIASETGKALPPALSRAVGVPRGEGASPAYPNGAPRERGYGEYGNVMLTDAEYAKVKAEFPLDWRARIDGLSAYVASTGKKYKSHFATIRNWARMERERASVRGPTRVSDNPFLDIAREEGII